MVLIAHGLPLETTADSPLILSSKRTTSCPVTHSFSNDIFAAFISYPYFVHLPSWNIYSCPDAKRLLGRVLILRVHDGKRPSTDEMSCHTIVGMWGVMRFSDPTCQILLFCYQTCSIHGTTYAPSVHVKTWAKPQLLTMFSSCTRVLPMLVTCDLKLDCRAIVRLTLVPLTIGALGKAQLRRYRLG